MDSPSRGIGETTLKVKNREGNYIDKETTGEAIKLQIVDSFICDGTDILRHKEWMKRGN